MYDFHHIKKFDDKQVIKYERVYNFNEKLLVNKMEEENKKINIKHFSRKTPVFHKIKMEKKDTYKKPEKFLRLDENKSNDSESLKEEKKRSYQML
jgi:hypothetical protein